MIPTFSLIDSHVHLDDQEFDADRDAVLTQARTAGICMQLIPATHQGNWQRIKNLCSQHADLKPAYGLHPMFLKHHHPQHLIDLESWIAQEKPIAIGECGLDFYIEDTNIKQQQNYFLAQLKLAREYHLPVVIHARKAMDIIISHLRKIGKLNGIVHSFSGSLEQATQLFKLGFLIGIGGPITYPRATRLRHLVQHMPLEYLCLETDAPDQPTSNHRGQRNEPAHLIEILTAIAHIRNMPHAEIAAQTTQNFRRVFMATLC